VETPAITRCNSAILTQKREGIAKHIHNMTD
jgi:hypothetical protein